MKRKLSIFIIIIFSIICILGIITYNKNKEKQTAFVKFNGNLYKKSNITIDYVGGDISIGKITQFTKQSIPQYDGETNREYLLGGIIFGTKNILNDIDFKDDEAIVIETSNSYILFEKEIK